MKKTIIIAILFIANLFVSCGSDGGGDPDLTTVTLTTTAPALTTDQLSFTSGGTASIKLENSNIFTFGICYNTSPNPTILNFLESANGADNKTFFNTVSNISFGTTYYIRAYIQNNTTAEVKYGNEVSIAVPLSLSTGIVKGISVNSFNVDITVGANLGNNTERGIVFGGGQNPIVTDTNSKVVPISSNGAGTFNVSPSEYYNYYYLVPNGNYYLRSYVLINGVYYYGNQVTFRSTGYLGGSGGYIFYDKGETTNGWRYLEAYTNVLTYSTGATYFNWSCNSNFLSGISNDIGTGYENSQLIKGTCNYTNVAAAVCLEQAYNGQSGWFVPSLDELKQLYKLKGIGLFTFGSPYSLLSSSQAGNATAWSVYFSNTNATNGTAYQVSKQSASSSQAWPVRRF